MFLKRLTLLAPLLAGASVPATSVGCSSSTDVELCGHAGESCATLGCCGSLECVNGTCQSSLATATGTTSGSLASTIAHPAALPPGPSARAR